MNEQLLKFENISKNYGSLEALKDINFSIPENSIFGILGANGSGKSTFMKILPNLIKSLFIKASHPSTVHSSISLNIPSIKYSWSFK